MYRIEKKGFGLRLTFGGVIPPEEMVHWVEDFRRELTEMTAPFHIFVDMRTLVPLNREAQVHMEEGQRLAREYGMERSVVIFRSPVTEAQFRRIGGATGIARRERYVNACEEPDWETVGLDWLLKEIEPARQRLFVADR